MSKDQDPLWPVVQQCAEAPAAQWNALIQAAGLGAGETQEVLAILAETEVLTGGLEHSSVGNYRILRKIAEGGMGVVYEAEQQSPRRTVALKMLKPGLSTVITQKRFQHEIRALGRVNHTGVAQIFDAGSIPMPFGEQQYFAMEFVDGPPLLEYTQRAGLDLRGRLELLVKVCDAVRHAHDAGIVHRDLKPANILVNSEGQPKVLDFGVASLSSIEGATTHYTKAGDMVGTLAYMSPEQVREGSLAADWRADVYALGVILYELVSGRPPYLIRGLTLPQAAHAICERDPDPLTSHDRSIPREVASIAAKALEKDPDDRYQSVGEFGNDLQRFLSYRPILAKPPGQREQILKFARRNRALAGALAGVLCALSTGTVVSTWQAVRARSAERAALLERDRTMEAQRAALEARDAALRAQRQAAEERDRVHAAEGIMRRERQRADLEAANATAISNFLQNDLLAQASPEMQGGASVRLDPDIKVRTALDRAAAHVEAKFAGKPLLEASIRQTLGTTYAKLGVFSEARKHLEGALELRRHHLGEDEIVTLESRYDVAWLMLQEKEFAAAEPILQRIVDVRTRLLGVKHPETMRAANALAGSHLGQMKVAQALPVLERLLRIMVQTGPGDDPATLIVMNNLGVALQRLGKYAEAEASHRKLWEIRRRKLGEEHPDTLISVTNRAVNIYGQGRMAEAETLHAQVLSARRKLLGGKHPMTLVAMSNVALAQEGADQLASAEEFFREVYEGRRAALGENSPDTLESLQALARIRILRADPLGAEAAASRVFASLGDVKTWQGYYSRVLMGACRALHMHFEEAESLLLGGYRGLESVSASIPVWQRPISIDLARKWIVDMYEAWGHKDRAAAFLAAR